MAFRILTEEEIALLTRGQRTQYEDELEIYQQRAAFVERMAELESAEIKPYEPKLEPVHFISGVDVRTFNPPEYEVTLSEPVSKPQIKREVFAMPELAAPVLPEVAAIFDLPVGRTVKIESVQPELPQVTKPDVECRPFVQSKRKPPVLPEVAKPAIAVAAWHQPEYAHPELPVNVHKMRTESKPFVMPKNIQPELPEIHAAFAEIKLFSNPEKANINLPTTVKPDIKAVSFVAADFSQPELPKVPALNIDIRAFKNPELPETKLPGVSTPNVVAPSVKQAKIKAPVLPPVTRLDITVKSFVAPQYTPDVTAPQAPNVKIKPMAKIAKANPKLPSFAKRSAVKIPDADYLLNELFPGRTENAAMEG